MKKALVVANMVAFVGFLWNDIDILQKQGYDVTFASGISADDNKHIKELTQKNVKFVKLNLASKTPFSRKSLICYRELKDLLKKEQFELIHCHTPIVGFLTRFVARKYREKTYILYTSHGLPFTRYSSKKERIVYSCIEKWASRYTDTIIVINHQDYNEAQKWHCNDVRLIKGVGVDTSYYHNMTVDKNEYKKNLGLPTEKIMILSVGELSARKNHQVIIKAIGRLPSKADYIYVICGKELGKTGVKECLRKLAKEKGVELYLLGHREDIAQIMKISDIGAIPSVREGLGLAGIESLCAEVPLVGSSVQGIEEYIVDGITGILCAPFDEKAFASAIARLSDEKTRERMKQHCYSVAKTFDISIARQQMEYIYSTSAIRGNHE